MRAIFEQITSDIITAIEQGADRYEMPWHRAGSGLPSNALTGEHYRGTNIIALWAKASSKGYATNRWATYRQWDRLGAQVRKGERSTTILFWKVAGVKDEAEIEEEDSGFRRLIARAARVFNADQVDDPPVASEPQPLEPAERIASAQAFFDSLPAVVAYGGDDAFYDHGSDTITLPEFAAFRSATGFYSVLAHELTHWTGHKRRVDRDLSGRFGSAAYALEELVAELGAAFLCGHLGIATEPRRDHAPYLANWLKVLRADPRALVKIASQAQAAVDFLVALSPTCSVAGTLTKEAA